MTKKKDSATAQRVRSPRNLREGIQSFFQGPRSAPASKEDSDLDFRRRLLEVYRKLAAAGELVAPLPVWVDFPLDEEALRLSPRLQSALAASTAYSPSKWLLEKELAARISGSSEGPSWSPDSGEDVYDAAAREELRGLCFSGGGIRSATFCLGVLQALAGSRKLGGFDYLSTVSGGGYIHQWLASWIIRDPDRFRGVEKKLIPVPQGACPARTPEQIHWLRRYSSYLTPRRGILSADTWTMIATWFRNTTLNQIVLFAFLAACILAIRTVTLPFMLDTPETGAAAGAAAAAVAGPVAAAAPWQWALGLCLVFLVVELIAFSSTRLWKALASVTAPAAANQVPPNALTDVGVAVCVVLPTFMMTVLVTLESVGRIVVVPYKHYPVMLIGLFLYVLAMVLAVTFGGQAPEMLKTLSRRPRTRWFSAAMVLSAVLVTVVALGPAAWLADLPGGPDRVTNGPVRITRMTQEATRTVGRVLRKALARPEPATPAQKAKAALAGPASAPASHERRNEHLILAGMKDRLVAVFFPVVFLFFPLLAVRLQLGLIGRFYTESRREWLARFGAWCVIFAAVWMILSGVALLGPPVLKLFLEDRSVPKIWGVLSVLAAHVATLYAGGSGKSDGKPKPGKLLGYNMMDLVGMVGAPACILILLIVVAGLVDIELGWIAGLAYPRSFTVLFALGVLGILFLFGWRIDVNEFSLHGFYRNRLARCYLGATDRSRTPDPFNHFDEHETGVRKGIVVSDLLPARFGGVGKDGDKPYDGPFPIFCSTINLTFGEDLGWQERKGASFAFTPFYSGYHVGWTSEKGSNADTTYNGFVRTRDYAYSGGGIPLATAAAISGAALSPNQGYSSTPSLAFLMTLFNVRLGWWLANTRKPRVWPSIENRPTPAFGIGYLLKELAGRSDDTSNYVCLSDGGRFENMGLYELVRRRVKHIVICDAEQDTDMVFAGIGNAIARCRTDFGAEIDLDLRPLRKDDNTGLSPAHFRTGAIHYPAPPGQTAAHRFHGTVVYIKSTLVGDEPADILHHRLTYPEFPQDSTVNQWFTESQFESYRRLGQLCAERASGKI
ncbi:MAG: hypothetical protein WCE75_12150 [Terracidiphilus sp.]